MKPRRGDTAGFFCAQPCTPWVGDNNGNEGLSTFSGCLLCLRVLIGGVGL
ncbi:MAG: hypothetical protein RJB34_1540 [Pseudomonadota bacterium]|jgi:hypothetical protein